MTCDDLSLQSMCTHTRELVWTCTYVHSQEIAPRAGVDVHMGALGPIPTPGVSAGTATLTVPQILKGRFPLAKSMCLKVDSQT